MDNNVNQRFGFLVFFPLGLRFYVFFFFLLRFVILTLGCLGCFRGRKDFVFVVVFEFGFWVA